jgi:hypothetical protein
LRECKIAEKPMTSVQLSEYWNYKIQNDFGSIYEDNDLEEDKEIDFLMQANNLERQEGRISC